MPPGTQDIRFSVALAAERAIAFEKINSECEIRLGGQPGDVSDQLMVSRKHQEGRKTILRIRGGN